MMELLLLDTKSTIKLSRCWISILPVDSVKNKILYKYPPVAKELGEKSPYSCVRAEVYRVVARTLNNYVFSCSHHSLNTGSIREVTKLLVNYWNRVLSVILTGDRTTPSPYLCRTSIYVCEDRGSHSAFRVDNNCWVSSEWEFSSSGMRHFRNVYSVKISTSLTEVPSHRQSLAMTLSQTCNLQPLSRRSSYFY